MKDLAHMVMIVFATITGSFMARKAWVASLVTGTVTIGIMLALILSSCATSPVAPVAPPVVTTPEEKEAPGEKPVSYPSACPKNTFCWDQLVLDHITPNMMAANIGSFCPKATPGMVEILRKKAWLNIIRSIAWAESSWNPNDAMRETAMGTDPVTGAQVQSEGLYQLSYQDARNWSGLPACKAIDYAKKNIRDPLVNSLCAFAIMDKLAARGKSEDISSRKSLGAYWSAVWIGKTRSRAKMKELMPECGL